MKRSSRKKREAEKKPTPAVSVKASFSRLFEFFGIWGVIGYEAMCLQSICKAEAGGFTNARLGCVSARGVC